MVDFFPWNLGNVYKVKCCDDDKGTDNKDEYDAAADDDDNDVGGQGEGRNRYWDCY